MNSPARARKAAPRAYAAHRIDTRHAGTVWLLACALLLQGSLGSLHPYRHFGSAESAAARVERHAPAARAGSVVVQDATLPAGLDGGDEKYCGVCLALHSAGTVVAPTLAFALPYPVDPTFIPFAAGTVTGNSNYSPAQARAPPHPA